jgi:hypothetical protein
MDLDEFTHLTLAVLEDQGTSAYAPTILADERVQVIQGIPEGLDHRAAIQETIQRLGLDHSDFYFGVKSGPGEITTGHHTLACTQFQRISEMRKGFVVSEQEDCAWWTVGQGRDQ